MKQYDLSVQNTPMSEVSDALYDFLNAHDLFPVHHFQDEGPYRYNCWESKGVQVVLVHPDTYQFCRQARGNPQHARAQQDIANGYLYGVDMPWRIDTSVPIGIVRFVVEV